MKKVYLLMEWRKDIERYEIFRFFDNERSAKECCNTLMKNGVVYFHPKFLIGQSKTIPRYYVKEEYISF